VPGNVGNKDITMSHLQMACSSCLQMLHCYINTQVLMMRVRPRVGVCVSVQGQLGRCVSICCCPIRDDLLLRS
jgi:hypothetical protein